MASNTSPATHFVAVTPSDSADIPQTRALYVGTTGDVACHNGSGTSVTFVGVPAGAVIPVQTSRVMSSNTTASDIVALY